MTSDEWESRPCRGVPVDVFFPAVSVKTFPRAGRDPYAQARRFCETCPLTRECLATYLELEDGFVGNTTPGERDAIRAGERRVRRPTVVERSAALRERLGRRREASA